MILLTPAWSAFFFVLWLIIVLIPFYLVFVTPSTTTEKILWIIVILALPVLGSIAKVIDYFVKKN